MCQECEEFDYDSPNVSQDAMSNETPLEFLSQNMIHDDIVNEVEPNESESRLPHLQTLSDKLLYFFLIFNISNRAMTYLLEILSSEGLDVPKSVYLLKKMPIKDSHISVIKSFFHSKAEMAYLSIKENIEFCLKKGVSFTGDLYNELQII